MAARLRPRVAPSLLLALACALCGAAAGDPRTAVAGQSCAPGDAVSGPVLADNFVPSMDDLNTNVSANGFGTSAVGAAGPNTVFGLGQCLRDLSPLDCKLCFAEVRSLLPKCYPRVGGRLFLDGCFGRYANYSFFGEARGPADAAVCGSGTSYTGADPRRFADGSLTRSGPPSRTPPGPSRFAGAPPLASPIHPAPSPGRLWVGSGRVHRRLVPAPLSTPQIGDGEVVGTSK